MICIYHSRDLDGYCSGAIVKKKYPEAKLIGFDYGQGLQKLLDLIPPREKIIMVDVSLPMNEMHELWLHSGSLTWIDHHESAINDYADYHKTHCQHVISFIAVLENGISACEGAWKWLFPKLDMPRTVQLLGEYDTWRNSDLSHWNNVVLPFQFGMRLNVSSAESFPQILLDSESDMASMKINEIFIKGDTILEYQKQQNIISMRGSFDATFEGYRVLACNGGGFNSQAFESKWNEDDYDLMMPFKYDGAKWIFSLYTTKDIDCSAIAKKYGGGGHKKAAGFMLTELPTFIIK